MAVSNAVRVDLRVGDVLAVGPLSDLFLRCLFTSFLACSRVFRLFAFLFACSSWLFLFVVSTATFATVRTGGKGKTESKDTNRDCVKNFHRDLLRY